MLLNTITNFILVSKALKPFCFDDKGTYVVSCFRLAQLLKYDSLLQGCRMTGLKHELASNFRTTWTYEIPSDPMVSCYQAPK